MPRQAITIHDGPIEDGVEVFSFVIPAPGAVTREGGLAIGVGLPSPSGAVEGGLTGTLKDMCPYARQLVEDIDGCLTDDPDGKLLPLQRVTTQGF